MQFGLAPCMHTQLVPGLDAAVAAMQCNAANAPLLAAHMSTMAHTLTAMHT